MKKEIQVLQILKLTLIMKPYNFMRFLWHLRDFHNHENFSYGFLDHNATMLKAVTNMLEELTTFIFRPEDGGSTFLSKILVNTFKSTQIQNAEDHNPYFSKINMSC
jgi:hypothetical protein